MVSVADKPVKRPSSIWMMTALVLASVLILGVAIAPDSRRDRYVAVYPFWWSQARATAAAASAGELLGVGGWTNTLMVAGDEAALADRLRRSGALLLIDSRLGVFCTSSRRETRA